jgi:hypothetical protein
MERRRIGRDKAIKLYDYGFYNKLTKLEIVMFQLFVAECSMPMDVFHEAIEQQLNRPISTVELGMNGIALREEFMENTIYQKKI